MSKRKPDYTKFMKRPAPLQMSPPTERDDGGPIRGPIREQDIPWAEIVEVNEPGIVVTPVPEESVFRLEGSPDPRAQTLKSRLWRAAYGLALRSAHAVRVAGSAPDTEAPPLPVLVLALVLFLLML
jgi:hypothetical protein